MARLGAFTTGLDLEALIDASPFPFLLLSTTQVILGANDAYLRVTGRTQEDIVGKPLPDVLPELAGKGCQDLLNQAFTEGKACLCRQTKVALRPLPGGPLSERYIDFVFQPVTDADNKVTGILIQGHDVTEQKQVQNALRLSNERLKLAIESIGDGIWDWNMDSGEVLYSRRFLDMFGYSEHALPNRYEAWESHVHPDDLSHARAAVQTGIRTGEPGMAEYRFQCADGSWKWVRSRVTVVDYGEHDKPLRLLGTMSDISEIRKSDELVWRQANFDALTGLPNRRLFRDRLDQEVKKAHRSPQRLGLMFIDLDRFKEVNDLLGHDTGDRLLVEAARRVAHCVRDSDTVARLGGDEFTVILSELNDAAHVEDIAQKILHALAQPFSLDQHTVYISGSLGIALYEDGASTAEQMIRNADQAMYAAKNAGRKQFRHFTPSMQEKAQRRLRLAHDLREALATAQLKVHYQPVVELTSGKIVKAEALLRWNHRMLGPVAPAQFIPIAEETGLINALGDWVFQQAATCLRYWQSQLDQTVQVSINTSPAQFHSAEQGVDWLKYLEMLGLLGSTVVVEITEGLLLNASPAVADKLFAYRDGGIQVAIDDFGIGYSSMQYLKQFDIDYLKIDQSFVRDMVIDASDRTIIKSMIVMAHELGMQVIAEGIETMAQRDLLCAAGCDFGQGFLFSQAVSAEEFGRLMVGQNQ
jgi:diguanylate cyclase (GGDEF)-like protein/PAS domain S-box-containing protein